MNTNRIQAEKLKAGTRIAFSNYGMQVRFGKVYGVRSDRWGTWARIKMDDYTFEEVSSVYGMHPEEPGRYGQHGIAGYIVALPR